MTRVTIISRGGGAHAIECTDGISLMENIRARGLDQPFALCGGNCSCGTCHVYIDVAWVERLPALRDDEDYLLAISTQRTALSRLSCQLVVTSGMDGLEAVIAPEDV